MSQYKSKEFLKLKDEWDKKLKDNGFEDIETFDRKTGESYLDSWDSHYFQARHDPVAFSIEHEYYHRAEHFLNSAKFRSKTDRQIWQQHSRGLGVRQIAQYLKDRGTRTNKDRVAAVIRRLKVRMNEATNECKNENSSQLDIWSQQILDLSTQPG